MPPEKNAFVDFLLARTVTGESPSKRDGLRSRQNSSPVRDKGKDKAADVEADKPEQATAAEHVKPTRSTSRQPKGKSKAAGNDTAEDGQPTAGELAHDVLGLLNLYDLQGHLD